MSASLDILEDLDNKGLRAKCIEFGLPNIPITDTSRKLLIKRLRTAMQGGAEQDGKEKAKSRRETIHVVKVETETTKLKATSTPTKTKDSSGRRTIGPAILTKDELPARETVTQRRRSGRTTPISQIDHVVQHSSKRHVSDVIQEDDEDAIPIPVIIKKSNEPSRQTRAPSLSKSVVVTTSYVKDAPKDIIELDESEPEEYEEEEELELEPEIEPIKYKYISSSRTYDTSKPFAPTLEKEPMLNYSSARIAQPASRISLSKAPTSVLSYESSTARRYTTGGYKSPAEAHENRTFVHHAGNVGDNEEDDQAEAPFLSDFARRLSRLKPEPLQSPVAPPKSEIVHREIPRYYPTTVSPRRGISQKDSISDSFNKFVVALDHKYHLKRNFTIFAIVLIIILVYVLCFN